jgi:multiple sugar transport system ATP-binding protein
MGSVSFVDATRVFPKAERPAVDNLNLEIADGEFLVLVGPSGCGKTTSLRMLVGLEAIDGGTILIDGEEVVDLPPRDRDIAMVFQNYALYPHLSVAQNIGFPLRIAGMSKQDIETRVREAAKILDLEDFLKRKPGQLSGGQRQRVAMGRAIVRQPRVFLMDEPLSNLDAKLRVATRAQIAALQRRLGVTTVYVTHDQTEAMTMGDRVAVMKDGILQQCDTPRELYEQPANAFVAGFIGSPPMNLLETNITEAGVRLGDFVVPIGSTLLDAAGKGAVTLGVRPEAVELCAADDGLSARVTLVEELGAEAFVYATINDLADRSVTASSDIVVRVEPKQAPTPGELVHLRVKCDQALLFDSDTGVRIAA